jgi:hypothetical protein
MDMLLLERESGTRQQERLHQAEQQCRVSGQRATLEQLARQQALRQATMRFRRAGVAVLGSGLAVATLVLSQTFGLVCF